MGLQETTKIASILSLIGGILMLIASAASSIWFISGGLVIGGMMSGYHTMMGNLGTLNSFIGGLSLIGLVSGIFVIIGAIMVNTRPIEHASWGLIILVFSITSFLGTGGFIIGAILGIMGGVLAMSWKPGSKAQ